MTEQPVAALWATEGSIYGRFGYGIASFQSLFMARSFGLSAGEAAVFINAPVGVASAVGTATTVGLVTSARGNQSEVTLKIPVCAEEGQRVAISRKIANKWRLIGYGIVE